MTGPNAPSPAMMSRGEVRVLRIDERMATRLVYSILSKPLKMDRVVVKVEVAKTVREATWIRCFSWGRLKTEEEIQSAER